MVARNSNLEALKLQFLRDFLEIQDVSLVKSLIKMVKDTRNDSKTSIVGYCPDGTPISLSELQSDLEEGMHEYREGKFTTIEDFEKEIESW